MEVSYKMAQLPYTWVYIR